MRNFAFALAICLVAGCARGPIKNPEQAMRPAKSQPILSDDLDFGSLTRGLDANIKRLKETPSTDEYLRFGPTRLAKSRYIASLEFLLAEAKLDPSGERFKKSLRENFDAYEVYGQNDWGQVFITSYFEPVIDGSRSPTERFSQPLFGIPKNMVVVDLDSFAKARPSLQALQGTALEQRSKSNQLRGILVPPKSPNDPARITAFPDRSNIVSGSLNGHAAELAWVDPIDAFFLEIQGSGVVRLEDGSEFKVGYAAQNGHPYVAIGKHLRHAIPLEKMSLQTIESHLRSLPRAEARKIMDLNPSYVFFRPLPGSGVTFFGTEVVTGRTIATDQTYFPKGALAFLEFDKPLFASNDATEPIAWEKTSRFVLDQDTGGAIRGPHRVDLFWGRGDAAKQSAGVIKNRGRLVYFVPRQEFLRRLTP